MPPAQDYAPPNTGDSLSTMAPGAVRQLWQKGIDMAEQTGDFFAPMEGKSKTSLIQTKTETSKGKGQKITFTTQSGFYNEGKMGDELFENPVDFEEILQDSYDLDVDYLRNAASINDRAEEKMGIHGQGRGKFIPKKFQKTIVIK